MFISFRRATTLAACTAAIVVAIGLRGFGADDATAEKSFSVVLLPDTQNYSEKYPETYVAQTLWIRERLKADNIKFVVHLGDIVQNSTKKPEWESADRAMRLLDGVVPYSMAPGNHDMVVNVRDSTLYNQYFSPARFAEREWYGGHMGNTNENKIHVKTYSPLLEKYNTDAKETFSLDYEMTAANRRAG